MKNNNKKKPKKDYNEKIKINATFDEVLKVMIETKPDKKKKKNKK